MSWLVTGVTGLLGANAATSLSDAGARVVGVARSIPAVSGLDVLPVDLSSVSARAGLVDRAGCDVVLHTAAVSSIEACERDPAAARELNTVAAADLAAQAARAGAAFVHISTDAVFDGERGGYREDDPVSPQSVYGRTKADAERAVLDANPSALVARVNFYGWSPTGRRSLLEFFARALSAGSTVRGFTDVRVSTLYVADLVDATRRGRRPRRERHPPRGRFRAGDEVRVRASRRLRIRVGCRPRGGGPFNGRSRVPARQRPVARRGAVRARRGRAAASGVEHRARTRRQPRRAPRPGGGLLSGRRT
jgi:dTDP-4-dehydrorhamnose reductase